MFQIPYVVVVEELIQWHDENCFALFHQNLWLTPCPSGRHQIPFQNQVCPVNVDSLIRD